MPIGDEEQEVKVQTATASWATEAKTGCGRGEVWAGS